jgi:hypothetical protein
MIYTKRIFFLLITLTFLATSGIAQEVLVSQEVSVRRDYSYSIIGKIDDRILVFRDLGFNFEINAFNDDLVFEWKREMIFEKKKVDILGIVPKEKDWTIYYLYKHKSEEYIMARKYDKSGEMIDSSTLSINSKSLVSRKHGYTLSENNNKVLLFYTDRDKRMHTYVVDNDSLSLDYERDIHFESTYINRDFRDMIISNSGDVYIIMEKDNTRFKKKKHKLEIYELTQSDESVYSTDIGFNELISIDLLAGYDNKNESLLIGGLYSDNSSTKALGYYYRSIKRGSMSSDKKIQFIPFDEDILRDVHGKKYDSNKTLNDFKVKEIISRNDGGIIMVTEMNKQLTRRNAYPSTNARSDYYAANGGWIDHYNEDVVVMALHPDGKLHWHTVLYKKQFAQDDEISFSSFFLFKNPSMLRIIYNDEIKRNNTVSEYVLDPLGRKKRKSLLSTEYQALQLRFDDAIQIASNEFIVPSERGSKMSLVKVKY